MLWTICVILLILWLLGLVSGYTMGGVIHILVVIAAIVLVVRLIQGREALGVRPGNTLCFVRDYHTLDHFHKALDLTDTGKKDLVVMTVQILRGPDTGYKGIAEHHLFTSTKQLLFTHVVALAEKEGKPVHLLVVPSSNVLDAIALTAAQLDSAEVIEGPSPVLPPQVQAERFRKAWEKLRDRPKHQVWLRIINPDGSRQDFPVDQLRQKGGSNG